MARPNSASAKRAAANRERAKKIQAANKAKKTAALERAKGSTKLRPTAATCLALSVLNPVLKTLTR